MSNKNKEKGKYLEEYVANRFKKHFNLDSRDVHRAQSSGVFHTEYGDIYFRKHSIIIECKNQQDVQLQRMFPSLSKTIYGFYRQVEKDVDRFKKQYPNQKLLHFLVVTNTSNRLPRYVILDVESLKKYVGDNVLNRRILIDDNPFVNTKYENKQFVIFLFDDFIKYINLDTLEY